MAKLVKLAIDGQQIEVSEGTLIVDAAKKIGIDVPVFCYHPKMEPVGMCRMCLVEIGRPVKDRNTGEWVREADGSLKIQFGPKLETACTTPVSEGMVVVGNSDKVQAGRKDIIEFLLTSHPLDCPICDKGGECPLQNLTMAFGPGQSRFILDEKARLGKHVPLGELIILDRERCIQCARCTRFQDEIVDDPVIGFFQRGRNLEIVTFSEPGFDSVYSGNTTDICPVGALTTVDFRFEARPWELMNSASICPHCPVGCNTTLNTRREARAGGKPVVKRVMPRQNEWVNEIWICDKGRFAYHFTQSEDRLTDPLVRKHGELVPVSWEEALETVAGGFREAGDGLLALGSGRLSNEDLFNLRALAEGLGGKAAAYTSMAGGDLVAKVGVGQGTNISEMGSGSAILVVACDLQEEAPIWWLRVKQAADRGASLIVLNPRWTKLDKHASAVYHYPYGAEAATVLSLVNALSAKRPDLGGGAPSARELEEIAQRFAGAENALVIYGSEGLDLEGSQALAQACANLLIATNHTGRAHNGLLAAWNDGNGQGVWDMGLRPLPDLAAAFGEAKALYVVAADPAGDDPALGEAARAAGFLVVQDLFLTDTARLADVVLPAQAFIEREGSYTNGERRVQRFYPGVPAWAKTRADYTITAQIGQLLGVALEGRSPLLVMDRQISSQVPDYAGVTYRKLAEVVEQWPIVGRADMYYGGTTYENNQGLGVQLSPAAQRGEAVSLGWVQPPAARAVEQNSLLAVPVTRLYDRARTVLPSHLLRLRIPDPYVALHPADAGRLGVQEGDLVEVRLAGTQPRAARVTARLDERVPAGILLVPRSMGIPIRGPEAAEMSVTEKVMAS
jgi:NADH-quinone oxidoreductase subunit G